MSTAFSFVGILQNQDAQDLCKVNATLHLPDRFCILLPPAFVDLQMLLEKGNILAKGQSERWKLTNGEISGGFLRFDVTEIPGG